MIQRLSADANTFKRGKDALDGVEEEEVSFSCMILLRRETLSVVRELFFSPFNIPFLPV